MYYALQIDIPEDASERLQALLDSTGTLGLEIRDHTLKLPPTAPPLRPGHVQFLAYYDDEREAVDAAAEVRCELSEASLVSLPIAQEDWSETWKRHVRAVRVGRVWVGPPWELPNAGGAPITLVIEPGMAFGTGDHPTTSMCLAALQATLESRAGASVLDVGTGSGVLAIAARKLGAGRVVGNDIEPAAVRIARENAELNNVKDLELTERPIERLAGVFEIVVANLFAGVLCQLAPRLAARLAPGGDLLLSGILTSQETEVREAFNREGLVAAGQSISGEWVLLRFRKGAEKQEQIG